MNNLDQVIEKIGDKEDFFFIEIGAYDGITGDPIHEAVVKNNWNGILVEPVPDYYDELLENYKNQSGLSFEKVAVSSESCDSKEFYYWKKQNVGKGVKGWEYGCANFNLNKDRKWKRKAREGIRGIADVKVTTVSELCDKHNATHVNLLHIAGEGHDFEIIKGIDFENMTPDVIHFQSERIDIRHATEFLNDKNYVVYVGAKLGYSLAIHERIGITLMAERTSKVSPLGGCMVKATIYEMANQLERIVAVTRYGLGNRIKFISYIKPIADNLGIPLEVYWPYVPGKEQTYLSDIFEDESLVNFVPDEIIKCHNQSELGYYYRLDSGKYVWVPSRPFGVKQIDAARFITRLTIRGEPGFRDKRNYFNRIRKETIQNLKLNKDVTDRVMEIPENTIGVHIRRTDVVGGGGHVRKLAHNKGRMHDASDEDYVEMIDAILEIDPDVKLYFASDGQETRDFFVDKYKENAIYYEFDYELNLENCRNEGGSKDAMAEMLTLAKTKWFISSPRCSFTEISELFGSRRIETTDIIKSINDGTFKENFERWMS